MPNTLMSATFADVMTSTFIHRDTDIFSLFHRMFELFFMVFAQNLELGLYPFSRSKIHENAIKHTFITFFGSTRLYEKGTPLESSLSSFQTL
jgi:hypothetical protein